MGASQSTLSRLENNIMGNSEGLKALDGQGRVPDLLPWPLIVGARGFGFTSGPSLTGENPFNSEGFSGLICLEVGNLADFR